MTEEEIRIKESELKYAISNLVDNLICYKGECENQADRITELEERLNDKENTVHTLDVLHKEALKAYAKVNDKLTKAKELLKKIEKIVYSGENEIKRLSKIVDVLAEAEQFLKEV